MKKIVTLLLAILTFAFTNAQQDDPNKKILSFDAPTNVKVGEEVTVTVKYKTDDKVYVRAFLQKNGGDWKEAGSKAKKVYTGTETLELKFKVEDHAEPSSPYKIVVSLMPLKGGWKDRFDVKTQMNVSVSK